MKLKKKSTLQVLGPIRKVSPKNYSMEETQRKHPIGSHSCREGILHELKHEEYRKKCPIGSQSYKEGILHKLKDEEHPKKHPTGSQFCRGATPKISHMEETLESGLHRVKKRPHRRVNRQSHRLLTVLKTFKRGPLGTFHE